MFRKLLALAFVIGLLTTAADALSVPQRVLLLTKKNVPGPCTGGTRTTSGGNQIITFTASGSLVCPGNFAAQFLAVGGGGGGGGGPNPPSLVSYFRPIGLAGSSSAVCVGNLLDNRALFISPAEANYPILRISEHPSCK